MSKVVEQFIETEYRSRKVPDFRVGDVVRVHQIVPDIKVEKKLSKTAKAIKKTQTDEKGPGVRTQVFEGTVIARKHGREPGATFTVRKIASGNIGVEKIFPLYSPLVSKVEVVSRPTKRVRRAKLYFLRDRVGKRARKLGVGTAVEQKVVSVEPLASKEEEAEPEEPKETPTPENQSLDSEEVVRVEKKETETIKQEAETSNEPKEKKPSDS